MIPVPDATEKSSRHWLPGHLKLAPPWPWLTRCSSIALTYQKRHSLSLLAVYPSPGGCLLEKPLSLPTRSQLQHYILFREHGYMLFPGWLLVVMATAIDLHLTLAWTHFPGACPQGDHSQACSWPGWWFFLVLYMSCMSQLYHWWSPGSTLSYHTSSRHQIKENQLIKLPLQFWSVHWLMTNG